MQYPIVSFSDCPNVEFSTYRIHVITSTLKLFFRQLAEPVVPTDFYDDFIRSAGSFNF